MRPDHVSYITSNDQLADVAKAIAPDVEVIWAKATKNDSNDGIVSVYLSTPIGVIKLD